jgi:streptogramin lyase
MAVERGDLSMAKNRAIGFLEGWKDVLARPKEALAARKKEKSSVGKDAGGLAIAAVVSAVLSIIFSALVNWGIPALLLMLFILLLLLLLLILAWLLAWLLGAGVPFSQYLHLLTLFLPPIFILGAFPVLNVLAWIWCLYLTFVLFNKVYGLGTAKTWIVILVPLLLLLLGWFLFFGGAPTGNVAATTSLITTTTTTTTAVGVVQTTSQATTSISSIARQPYDPSKYVWVNRLDGSTASVTKLYRSNGSEAGTYRTSAAGRAIAIDTYGNVWIPSSDEESPGVTKIDGATGAILGTYQAGADSEGIAADGLGNVWITSRMGNTVTKLDNSGKLIGTYPVGADPFGIAVDRDNNVWVANSYGQSVMKLDGATGAVLSDTPLRVTGQLATDSLGNVWVTAGNIFKLDSGGRLIGDDSGHYAYNAAFIAVDGSDNLWASTHEGIIKLSPEGMRLGTYPIATDEVTGISADEDSNIWVVIGEGWNVLKLNGQGALLGNYTLPRPSKGNPAISIGDMTGFALKHSVLGR